MRCFIHKGIFDRFSYVINFETFDQQLINAPSISIWSFKRIRDILMDF